MWRRFGDAGYALFVVVTYTLEAVVLAGLLWAFLVRGTELIPDSSVVGQAIVIAVAATALGLMVLSVHTITYQVIRSRRDLRYAHDVRSWTDRWIDVLFAGSAPPPGPLPPAAVDAILDLGESVRGDAATTIRELVVAYGIDTSLISQVKLAPAVRPEGPATRIGALERLARARSPEAVSTLMAAADDPDRAVRVMAVRALVRSASTIPDAAARQAATERIVDLLRASEVSGSALDEALQLLEDAAPFAVSYILGDAGRFGPRFVCAALDAIGRLGLSEFVHTVASFADHRRIAVRAAAIRSLTDLGRIPSNALPAIRQGLHDRNEVVRIEAARSARLLDPEIAVQALRPLLEDGAWTVRRVAAASLAAVGEPGRTALTETALEHRDPHARSAASEVLVSSKASVDVPAERTR